MKKRYNIIIVTIFSLFSFSNTFGAFRFDKVDEWLIWDETWDIWNWIVNTMTYLLGFLALVWVIWAIYAGFQILTAWWDDEKVKNWKKTLLFTLIWIFVIWIAWALIWWINSWLENNT